MGEEIEDAEDFAEGEINIQINDESFGLQGYHELEKMLIDKAIHSKETVVKTPPRKPKTKKAKSPTTASRKRTKKAKVTATIKSPSTKSQKKQKSPPQSPDSLELKQRRLKYLQQLNHPHWILPRVRSN